MWDIPCSIEANLLRVKFLDSRAACIYPSYPFCSLHCPVSRAATTTQRMMDNGIGMDMVSLSRPPLHTAPLFISKKRVPVDMALATSHEAAAAARVKEHEQLFPRQHGVDSPLAGAGAGGGGSRRMSINSDEAIPREQPKYEASVRDNRERCMVASKRRSVWEGGGAYAFVRG